MHNPDKIFFISHGSMIAEAIHFGNSLILTNTPKYTILFCSVAISRLTHKEDVDGTDGDLRQRPKLGLRNPQASRERVVGEEQGRGNHRQTDRSGLKSRRDHLRHHHLLPREELILAGQPLRPATLPFIRSDRVAFFTQKNAYDGCL